MFTHLTNLLTTLISVLLPTFLTYKALSLPNAQQTPQTLHPWLTYWTINSLLLSVPSVLPFDAYIRLALHIYILIPGRAESLWQGYVAPWMREHEGQIEAYLGKSAEAARGYAWDVVGKVREVLVGGSAERERLQREQEEQERRRMEAESAAGGFVGNLLARWTSESRAQEVRHQQRQRGAGDQDTLATRLGGLASQAAAVGVGKLQQAVDDAGKRAPEASASSSNAQQGTAAQRTGLSSLLSGMSRDSQTSSSAADLTTSKSEADFEKIEQHEAPSEAPKASAAPSSSWSGWLWGNKSARAVNETKSA